MAEYIYIASNKSMPGLVKIGRTSNPPTRRMSELNTTGVPTPFVLEFVAEVGSSHFVERRIHEKLTHCRVSKGREFFKTDVLIAITSCIEVAGTFNVIWDYTPNDYNIAELVAKKQKEAKEKEAKRVLERDALISDIISRTAPVLQSLSDARKKLEGLGQRPLQPTFGLIYILATDSFGWLFWLPSFYVFSDKKTNLGFICLGLSLLGYWLMKHKEKRLAQYNREILPWRSLDAKVSSLKLQLANLEREKDHAENPPPTYRRSPWVGKRHRRWRR